MNLKISVIVPVYNTKDFLQQSVDSIIAQKDFIHELILVDDGSTDGSGELLEKLYSGYDFVKIFHTENQRQGPARNLGTEKSEGEFIYYFDSDDTLKPGLFQKFKSVLEENNDVDIFCFSAEPFIDLDYGISKDERIKILTSGAYSRKMDKVCSSGEEAFNLLYPLKSFSPLPYLYIFRKSVILKNNIKYRSIRFEDEEFVFQLFLHSGKTVIMNRNFVNRRIREGSTMELNRCFADIVGYFETIETLNKFLQPNMLKNETKANIKLKIKDLTKSIIMIKVKSRLKLTKEEIRLYKKYINPILNNNRDLKLFSYRFPFEYRLRMIKKKFQVGSQ